MKNITKNVVASIAAILLSGAASANVLEKAQTLKDLVLLNEGGIRVSLMFDEQNCMLTFFKIKSLNHNSYEKSYIYAGEIFEIPGSLVDVKKSSTKVGFSSTGVNITMNRGSSVTAHLYSQISPLWSNVPHLNNPSDAMTHFKNFFFSGGISRGGGAMQKREISVPMIAPQYAPDKPEIEAALWDLLTTCQNG